MIGKTMTTTKIRVTSLFLALCWAGTAHSQSSSSSAPQQPDKHAPAATTTPSSKRLTIEVTGGDKDVAVDSASVYVKFVEVKKIGKDKKYELNVKTNRDGVAHIPDPPIGRVLIQIVADGWKTFGQYYEIADPGTVIKIHLDRPPKWY
jgi:hypothetical protein